MKSWLSTIAAVKFVCDPDDFDRLQEDEYIFQEYECKPTLICSQHNVHCYLKLLCAFLRHNSMHINLYNPWCDGDFALACFNLRSQICSIWNWRSTYIKFVFHSICQKFGPFARMSTYPRPSPRSAPCIRDKSVFIRTFLAQLRLVIPTLPEQALYNSYVLHFQFCPLKFFSLGPVQSGTKLLRRASWKFGLSRCLTMSIWPGRPCYIC